MKDIRVHIIALIALLTVGSLQSCSNEMEELAEGNALAVGPLSMEVSLEGALSVAGTRAVQNTTDLWTVSSFEVGDRAGFYTLGGIQNPDDPDDFSLTASNAEVFCQSKSGSYYRFGNSDIIVDPLTINQFYSRIFYPYYAEMPVPPYDSDPQPGMPLRRLDERDGIEKCVDFMMSESEKIPITNGAIRPAFQHNFCPLYIKRGNGFQNAPDKRIWVVMRNPFTDVRITQTSESSAFTYTLQYNPEETDGSEMIYIIPGESKFKVNKYAVWQAWDGANTATNFTHYTLIPTGPSVWQSIYFVYIQDDYGNWQNVDDFYLYTSGSKSLQTGYYYTLTISLQGVDVVARPISVMQWNDEVEITDNRKMGINDYVDYNEWARIYNTYIQNGRPRDMEDDLSPYGEGVYNTVTERTSWTFLINHDIDFLPNNSIEFSQITKLEDALEGTSSYTHYRINNPQGPLIGELTADGALRNLELRDLYFIQGDNDNEPYSPLIRNLNGGRVENCNVLSSIIVSHSPVGMVAGSANGGVVTGCTFSGDVIGTESATTGGKRGLFGTVADEPAVSSTNTTGLQFIEY